MKRDADCEEGATPQKKVRTLKTTSDSKVSRLSRDGRPLRAEVRTDVPTEALRPLTLKDAERCRRTIFGGPPLGSALNALGAITDTSTAWDLNNLLVAFQTDIAGGVSAPRVLDRVFGSEFQPGYSLNFGDVLHGEIGDQRVRIRITSLPGHFPLLAAVFFLQGDGSWKCYEASMKTSRTLDMSRICWIGKMTANWLREPLVAELSNGRWQNQSEGIQFTVTRSRAHMTPASPLLKMAEIVDAAWSECGSIISLVGGCKELRADLKPLNEWREEFARLQARWNNVDTEKCILFVGASGAGKSKLINQLLGDASILPSAGEGSAVTAAPVEIRFQPPSAATAKSAPGTVQMYRIVFEFFSKEEFVQTRDSMLKNLLEFWELLAKQHAAVEKAKCTKKKANTRLKFGQRKLSADSRNMRSAKKNEHEKKESPATGSASNHEIEATLRESSRHVIGVAKPPPDDDAQLARMAHDWLEAVYGTNAFSKGWASSAEFRQSFANMPSRVGSLPQTRNCSAQSEVVEMLQKWLVQAESAIETGQLWPLVKSAKLWGPWQVLARNMVFIDLPGFGDANAVRNSTAQRQFERAHFVVICSRIDRAATDKGSLEWLHKARRDLPEGSTAYVCTKSDDVSKDELIRDHGLAPSTTRSGAARVRNEKVKARLQADHPVKVYTVSARDYSRCVGLEDAIPETFLDEDSTEIPHLRAGIVDAVLQRELRDRMLLLEALEANLSIMVSQLTERPNADCNGAALRADFDALHAAFVSEIEASAREHCQRLTSESQRLQLEARRAARDGVRCLGSKAAHYGSGTRLHWARHKALIDRDGEWQGMDISADITRPVVNGIDEHFTSAFNATPRVAEDLKKKLLESANKFVLEFSERLTRVNFGTGPAMHVKDIGASQIKGIAVAISEDIEVFSEKVRSWRRGYAEDLDEAVRTQMPTVLAPAKRFAGTGSFVLRKGKVTEQVAKIELDSTVDAPTTRMKRVLELFSNVSTEMVRESAAALQACYADFWGQANERSEHECTAKAALRSVVQPQHAIAFSLLERAQAASLP